MGPKTAAADLAVKLRQARGFIEKGHRVKASVPFRAPERGAAQVGERLFWPVATHAWLLRGQMSRCWATSWVNCCVACPVLSLMGWSHVQEMLARLREVAAEFAAVAEPQASERLPRNTVAIYLSPPG